MADLTELLPGIAVEAPDAPEPLMLQHLRRAAQTFFTETRAWRELLPAVADPQNPAAYALALPEGAELVDLISVRLDRVELRKSTQTRMLGLRGVRPTHVRKAGNGLAIAPTPPEPVDARLSVLAALRPTRVATTLDDQLVSDFEHILVDGALSTLLLMGSKPWTDYAGGGTHRAYFLDAIDRWRSRASDDGQTGVARRVRYGGL